MRDKDDVSITETTDRDALAAVAAGDRRALRLLYDRHAPWLTARLQRRCADPDRVDDALQDTFLAVWRGAARWEGSGDVGAWIWGIAIRRLIDSLRRHPARAPLPGELAQEPSVEEAVLQSVEYGDLAGALNRLSPELRAVVQATILDDLSTKEAGRLLGIPTGTVKTRMMRARAELREELA
jgi:RNA polymerase sigma-70 factor (ECF subfamily)